MTESILRVALKAGLSARGRWTGRSISVSRLAAQMLTVPLLLAMLLPVAPALASPAEAQVPPARLWDLTISLYRSPTSAAARAPYERLLEYFADGVFESSNGAHKIRRISIYSGGAFADQADVVWVANCHPSARIAGRATPGAHINMCDVFNTNNYLQDDWGQQGGGYTLAHEWGHYFYAVYDEYRGGNASSPWISSPLSTDDPVPNAIMNSQWNARGGNFAWLNFSTIANNTRNTAQHRVYDASCWETLARPPAFDPRDGQRVSLPQRMHYPELASVAPGRGQAPRIDLPGTARSDLQIVWVGGEVTYQIVLDHSGSMDLETRMANAKAAAKLLVDLAPVGDTTIGVISFDDTVTVVQPLTTVTSQATKATIKANIDRIKPDGNTAIGDAARRALDDLLALGSGASKRAVYLLTDGQNNTGIDPRSVIAAYQSARVPLFTFAYGSGADTALLQEMAQATGGKYYFSPTTLAQLTQVFQDANQLSVPTVGVTSGQATVPASASSSFPIQIDTTLKRLDLVVTYQGDPGAVDLSLVDAQGTASVAAECSASGAETICYFGVEAPAPGIWELRTIAGGGDAVLTYRVGGSAEQEFTYAASLTSLTGEVVRYPEPIVLLATLGKELPIAGARVNATVQRPDGTVESFPLRDDGIAPDATADDGLYSAILDYSQDGPHNITTQFDNSGGTAQLTYVGLQPSAGEDGVEVPFPDPIPIAENFERFARIQVNTLNVQADDHGNTTADATALPADNRDVPGRIDHAGDLDVFEIYASGTGEITVRVSNLALGMDPKVRVLAGDGSTALAEADLATSGTTGYVILNLTVAAGDVVFAEVSDRGAAIGGSYAISAGSRIAHEITREITGVPGDGDGDGFCTEVDALMALQMAAGAEAEDPNLDVDQDGQVTEVDALTILGWAVRDGQCG